MATSNSPSSSYTIHFGERGHLVLPAKLRRQIDLQAGDHIVMTVEDDNSLRLVNLRHQVEQCQGIFKDIYPEGSLADELIQDRRVANQQER